MTQLPQTAIDPITLEIQWQRLIAIMDEVDNAVVRTSFSTIVGESRDFAVIMTDQRGASLCQSSFSPPNFCVVLPRTSRHMLDKFPPETLREGDVLVTNDAWMGTGHLPDYVVLNPIFWQGKVVAFTGIVAHLSDVGGHNGDIEAVDVFQEGLRLTPCKLFEAGAPNELLFEIIGNNCRVPDLVLGDLRAIVGAGWLAARRIQEFLGDYGLDDLVELSTTIHDRSEAIIRERISALPDGRYEFGLDIDGYIDPVHLHALIEIRGSDVYVDYTGSSPQTRKAAINCTFNTTFASTMYPFKCALVPDIPNNEGLFRPIHVSAPAGSILNCTFPAPVKARAKTTNNINQVLFGALWPIFGAHAQAGSGSIWPFKFFGDEPEYGRFGVHCLPHGGRGAMRDLDGMVPIAFPHNSTVTPSEILELRAPILIEKKELRPDSGGPGQQRGGLGQEIIVRSIGTRPMTLILRPDKMFFNPPGLNGGQPGVVGQVFLNGEEITRFPALTFNPGDELRLLLPGGGGFGLVEARDPALTLHDVAMGYISIDAAEHDYLLKAGNS
ncbi:MAG: hydantoinase B/oxoprolinase family protein [Chloroflexales bacterium]|nr:hydantoinase B/oxoprolinase family protein [Chloroflexales bacterium]